MNTTFKLLAISTLFACASAHAGTIQIGGGAASANGKMTTKAGVCSFTFDGASSCGATVTETGNTAGNVVNGSVSGQYAAPAGDTSNYLSVSPSAGSPVTFTVTSGTANYFGFFAGSLDSYNLVQFYLGATLVDMFNGTAINAVAFPGQATNGNQAEAQYIDYFPTTAYDRVTISSTQNAFELDNLAIGRAAVVPEPESLALLGLGALAVVGARRRRPV